MPGHFPRFTIAPLPRTGKSLNIRAMPQTIKIALVGTGMFGGDVHLRAYADLQRFGIAGQLARVGLDPYTRELAGVDFDLVAVATRSEKSAQKSASALTPTTPCKCAWISTTA